MEYWQITIKLRYKREPQIIDINVPAGTFIGHEAGWFRIGSIYSTSAKDVIWWHKKIARADLNNMEAQNERH